MFTISYPSITGERFTNDGEVVLQLVWVSMHPGKTGYPFIGVPIPIQDDDHDAPRNSTD